MTTAKPLTEDEKRIRIAEHLGWRHIGTTGNHGIPYGLHPDTKSPDALDDLPDWFADLNAMAEAEKMLPDKLRGVYDTKLSSLILVSNEDVWLISAPAKFRAEGFGLALNLW